MYKIINGIKIDEFGNLDNFHAENAHYVSAFINNVLVDDGDQFNDLERNVLFAAKFVLDQSVFQILNRSYIQEKEC